jgi:hypothetical protein
MGIVRRATATAVAALMTGVLLAATTGPATAAPSKPGPGARPSSINLASGGQAGPAGFIDAWGQWEGRVGNGIDLRYASVQCHASTYRRAAFGRVAVAAYNLRAGTGNDVQYVRATPLTFGTDGTTGWGATSGWHTVRDDRWTILPESVVWPASRARYNPAVRLTFHDSSGRELGSRIIAPEVGANWYVLQGPPYSGYWFVSRQNPVTCS